MSLNTTTPIPQDQVNGVTSAIVLALILPSIILFTLTKLAAPIMLLLCYNKSYE